MVYLVRTSQGSSKAQMDCGRGASKLALWFTCSGPHGWHATDLANRPRHDHKG